MKYKRMPIEIESPEQMGYDNIKFNLTESSVTDRSFKELFSHEDDFPVSYGDHLGYEPLRILLAAEFENITPENVITTIGAASALFIISTSLLDKDDHAVILNPNYATNLETPRLLQCHLETVSLNYENKFKLDLEEIKKKVRPQTRLISMTFPHNPTGACIDKSTLIQLVELAENNNSYLLLDETYRDMQYGEMPELAASLSERCISVSSLSKTYGLPGIRSGWLMTQNKELLEMFLAAKEQIFVTGSLVDEYLSHNFLKQKDKLLTGIKSKLLHHRSIVSEWIDESPYFEWIEPQGGCVGFPRIIKGSIDTSIFYKFLNEQFETYVGPGHWFEQPDRYFRLGYGYPDEDELRQGLKNLDEAMKLTVT